MANNKKRGLNISYRPLFKNFKNLNGTHTGATDALGNNKFLMRSSGSLLAAVLKREPHHGPV